MKVALIVPGGVDRSGRARVIPVLLNLIERLAKRHTVHVVSLNQEPGYARYPLLGATVTNLGRSRVRLRGASLARQYRKLLSLLRTEGPFDVLHAFWVNGPGTLATMAGQTFKIPAVISIGGGEFAALPHIGYGGQSNWISRRQIAYALRRAAIVSAGSRFALEQCGHAKALWLPLGVDTTVFHPSANEKAGPPWRLLQVASLNRVKDPFTALRAVRILLDRGLDVEFNMIGEDTLASSVQKCARDLSLSGRVRISDFRPNDELVDEYRRAHLYVQSSLHESQGVAVLEAAASGLPIAGTEVGLVAELAPSAAVSVPVADPSKLADAIETVLGNEGLRSRLGKAARAFACKHDADWTCARFEELYLELKTNNRCAVSQS